MTRFKYILKAFIFLILSVFLISSCEKEKFDNPIYGSISGKVLIDNDLDSPLIGAVITTKPATGSVTTDSTGKFSMQNIPVGDVSIIINKQGYSQSSTTVNIKEGKNTEVVLKLDKINKEDLISFEVNSPAEASSNNDISIELSWSINSKNKLLDTIFNVKLIESNNNEIFVEENLRKTAITFKNLKYGTTYYWQLELKEEESGGILKTSTMWSFKTKKFPDLPIIYSKKLGDIYNIYAKGLEDDAEEINITQNESISSWKPIYNSTRSHIAFSSNKTLVPQIYIMKKNGEDIYTVTKKPNTGYHNQGEGFCWSPDGQMIVYSNYENLYSININGTELNLIATAPAGRHFRKVEWNGHTNKIIVQTIGYNIFDSEVYIMDADGSNMTVLVSNTPGREDSPSLSIDGKKYMYTHDADGFENEQGRRLNNRIYIANVDGSGDITDISKNKKDGTNDINPKFSSNGAYIIFENIDNTGQGKSTIMIMDLDGSNRKVFSEGEMPYWG